jgi:hypothetical protein
MMHYGVSGAFHHAAADGPAIGAKLIVLHLFLPRAKVIRGLLHERGYDTGQCNGRTSAPSATRPSTARRLRLGPVFRGGRVVAVDRVATAGLVRMRPIDNLRGREIQARHAVGRRPIGQ